MSKICESARGGQCQIRLPGICNHNPETVVLAHYRMAGSCGMGMKPNDAQAAYACSRCHDAVDGRRAGLSREEKEFYMRRSQTRTLLRLIERGIVRVEQ